MSIDPTDLGALPSLAFARLKPNGDVRGSTPAFERVFRPSGGEGQAWSAAPAFLSPTFADLRARAEAGHRTLHEGLFQVAADDAIGASLHGVILAAPDGDVLVLAEAHDAAYEEVVRELAGLNHDLADLQREQTRTIDQLQRTERELRQALSEVRTLRGLLPTCATCKRIKNEAGEWERMETYIERRSEAQVSHGICTTCLAAELAQLDG